jgi:aspartate racemase
VHLGLIGGIGPAATAYYYRQLVASHMRAGRRLELTIAHADLSELLQNLRADARHAQGQVFGAMAHRLQAAGADVVRIENTWRWLAKGTRRARCDRSSTPQARRSRKRAQKSCSWQGLIFFWCSTVTTPEWRLSIAPLSTSMP